MFFLTCTTFTFCLSVKFLKILMCTQPCAYKQVYGNGAHVQNVFTQSTARFRTPIPIINPLPIDYRVSSKGRGQGGRFPPKVIC